MPTRALKLAKIDFVPIENGVVAPSWGSNTTDKIVGSTAVPSNSCRKWFQQELDCCVRLVVWGR